MESFRRSVHSDDGAWVIVKDVRGSSGNRVFWRNPMARS